MKLLSLECEACIANVPHDGVKHNRHCAITPVHIYIGRDLPSDQMVVIQYHCACFRQLLKYPLPVRLVFGFFITITCHITHIKYQEIQTGFHIDYRLPANGKHTGHC